MVVWKVTESFRRRLAVVIALLAFLLIARGGMWLSEQGTPVLGTPGLLEDVRTGSKVVALTVDLAWGREVPESLLDILAQEKVPATFFIAGPWAAENPQLVRRMAADRHEIGSRSYKQINLTQYPREIVDEEIERAQAAIEAASGRTPRFFRAPNGDYNALIVERARAKGYIPVRWSLDSQDWLNPGTDYIVQRVLSKAKPGDIILFNANDTDHQTPDALRLVINGLRKEGYEFVTVSELLLRADTSSEDNAPTPAEPSSAATAVGSESIPGRLENVPVHEGASARSKTM